MASKEHFNQALANEITKSNLSRALAITQEFIGRNQGEIADLYVDEHIKVFTGLNPTGPVEGRETYKQVIADLHRVFPDLVQTINDVVPSADGQSVGITFSATGTFAQEMWGVQPTNAPLTFIEHHLMKFNPEGKLIFNQVSAVNLEFEMIFSSAISAMLFPEKN